MTKALTWILILISIHASATPAAHPQGLRAVNCQPNPYYPKADFSAYTGVELQGSSLYRTAYVNGHLVLNTSIKITPSLEEGRVFATIWPPGANPHDWAPLPLMACYNPDPAPPRSTKPTYYPDTYRTH